ncbi:50S ribosomal protein L19e [Candidatus Micrarchaeota archaeon]|nr:50S ribosomal protein L19e [Candidatus Micrarchaeota archaeon]
MTISTVRRLAADIFGIGKNKVRISPDGLKDAEGALTRADVKGLIDKGVVSKIKPKGRLGKKKKKRRGPGSKKGRIRNTKTYWMQKVRAQRKLLRLLIGTNVLNIDNKRQLYAKIKSGIFRSKNAMLLYLKDNKLIPEDYELPKQAIEQKAKPVIKKKVKANDKS